VLDVAKAAVRRIGRNGGEALALSGGGPAVVVAADRALPRALRPMGLPEAALDDITWHNCFRFLGVDPLPKLSSSREQHRIPCAGLAPLGRLA